MTGDDGEFGPLLALPSEKTEAKLKELNAKLSIINQEISSTKEQLKKVYEYSAELIHNTKSISEPLVYSPFEKVSK